MPAPYMTKPNFLVIGAPRSGTSSLYEGLAQHPDIFLPAVKEPWFYAFGSRRHPFRGPRDRFYYHYMSRAEYEALFAEAGGESAIGEASTIYLYSQEARERIHAELPRVKLIAILRHPVRRGYSNYIKHLQQGREFLPSYEAALAAEEKRIRGDWSPYWFYRSLGFYGRQLSEYFARFDRARIKVLLLDDLKKEPRRVYRDLFEFLEVDPSFVPGEVREKKNSSQIPRNMFLQRFLSRPNPLRSVLRRAIPRRVRTRMLSYYLEHRKVGAAPRLRPEVAHRLGKVYTRDIHLLERLIDRDLSHWIAAA